MVVEKVNDVFRCSICGNIVEILHAGKGELVCCGKPMELLEPKSEDPDVGEKHVPVLDDKGDVINVKVGGVSHPMNEDHYIEFIELIVNDKVYRKFLKPGDEPEVEFGVGDKGSVSARAYCNIHGFWESLG